MIKKISRLAFVAVLTISPLALAQQAPSAANLPSEETIKSFVQHTLGYDSTLTYTVQSVRPAEAPGFSEVSVLVHSTQGDQIFKFFVTPDQHFAMVGDLIDFGSDPFARYRTALQRANGPSKGPKNAKVTIVEFADLQCPACKAALPNIEKMQSENPNVRVIFQNFPLEKVHPWALRASEYVECLKSGDDIAWKFIDTVYEHQAEINEQNADESLKKYSAEAGADPAKTAACVADTKTHEAILASEKLGEDVFITATPTLFVNGRKIASFNSLPYEVFKQLVDFAAK